MSRGPRHWHGRKRRPNHAGAQRKQDVLVLAWRDDEGTLHAIPSISCDLRNDDEETRLEHFDRFCTAIATLGKELACCIEVTRIQDGVATRVAKFKAGGGLESEAAIYPPAWRAVIKRAYAILDF